MTHDMYNKTQMVKLLDILWKKITMNFIIKLLKSKDSTTKIMYNSIMVVINKLIKHVCFINFKEIFDAKQLRHFFIDWII